jgi:hypothetical protein
VEGPFAVAAFLETIGLIRRSREPLAGMDRLAKLRIGGRMKTKSSSNGEAAALEKIAAMGEPFTSMGERLHALILRSAPALEPTTWYGMPAYAKDGKTVCFFRADKKYMTFGISQDANLTVEKGAPHQLIESSWYFTALDDATEAKLSEIVRKIAS